MTLSLILEANWVQNICDLSTFFHPFSHIPGKRSARTSLGYFKSSSFNGLVQRQNRYQATGPSLGKHVSEEKVKKNSPYLFFFWTYILRSSVFIIWFFYSCQLCELSRQTDINL